MPTSHMTTCTYGVMNATTFSTKLVAAYVNTCIFFKKDKTVAEFT